MQLDIFTLLIAGALATAFCAAARIVLWRMHPAVPGPGRWAAAAVLGACALALMTGRGTPHEAMALSLAQILIAGGFLLSWDGFRRFLGRAPLSPEILGLIAVGVLGPIALAQFDASMALRKLSNALAIAFISAMIARELLRPNERQGIAQRLTGAIYAANALFFAVQPWIGEARERFDGFGLLWWLGVTVAITLGMILMASERLQADLDRQASRDPLTGALNRRAFALLAGKGVSLARRTGRPVAVLMMDLDHFKRINDLIGHAGGDAILCRFVAVAGRVLRTEDVFCRFGGEEFVALLPDTDGAHALTVAERLRRAYAEEAALLHKDVLLPFDFTVSIGVSQVIAGEAVEPALKRADVALYNAKAAGRNRCEFALAEALAG